MVVKSSGRGVVGCVVPGGLHIYPALGRTHVDERSRWSVDVDKRADRVQEPRYPGQFRSTGCKLSMTWAACRLVKTSGGTHVARHGPDVSRELGFGELVPLGERPDERHLLAGGECRPVGRLEPAETWLGARSRRHLGRTRRSGLGCRAGASPASPASGSRTPGRSPSRRVERAPRSPAAARPGRSMRLCTSVSTPTVTQSESKLCDRLRDRFTETLTDMEASLVRERDVPTDPERRKSSRIGEVLVLRLAIADRRRRSIVRVNPPGSILPSTVRMSTISGTVFRAVASADTWDSRGSCDREATAFTFTQHSDIVEML